MTHSIPTNKFHALIMQQEAEHETRKRNTPPFYHFILYTGTKREQNKNYPNQKYNIKTLEYQSGRFNTLTEAKDGYTAWIEKSNVLKTNDWFPIFYFVENGEGTECI